MHERFAERIARIYIDLSVKLGKPVADDWACNHVKYVYEDLAQIGAHVRRLTDWSTKNDK
jgi:hypothetical protein